MGEWIDERGERKVVWVVLGWRKKLVWNMW
jgi:hypothetical protein